MKELLDLYVSFFKIGILTFGGGMAMLPMLNSELVEKRKWVTEEEILDYFATAESDSVELALKALGEDDYTEEEIRVMRIKYLSDVGN